MLPGIKIKILNVVFKGLVLDLEETTNKKKQKLTQVLMNALLCEKAEVLNEQNQLANDFSPKKKKKWQQNTQLAFQRNKELIT